MFVVFLWVHKAIWSQAVKVNAEILSSLYRGTFENGCLWFFQDRRSYQSYFSRWILRFRWNFWKGQHQLRTWHFDQSDSSGSEQSEDTLPHPRVIRSAGRRKNTSSADNVFNWQFYEDFNPFESVWLLEYNRLMTSSQLTFLYIFSGWSTWPYCSRNKQICWTVFW